MNRASQKELMEDINEIKLLSKTLGLEICDTIIHNLRTIHPATLISKEKAEDTINKAKAMKVLRSRLYEIELQKQQDEIARDRKSQVGTGERSEKIRTYNFPQNRITDHRIGFTTHRLTEILDGDIDDMIDTLVTHYQSEKLKDVETAAS